MGDLIVLRVAFHTPPRSKQIGGIENAISGLRGALLRSGNSVCFNPPVHEALCDIHHIHGLWNISNVRLAHALKKSRQPYVVSPHGMLEPWAFRRRYWKKMPFFNIVERKMLLGAESIFVTSELERRHLLARLDHRDVRVLPLGCSDPKGPDYQSARLALGWRPDEKVMLFLSRIDPKKGIDILLEGMARRPNILQEWRLVVVGDGTAQYLRQLRDMAHALSSHLPHINWEGSVWGEERWKYLQAADLFVLPTHSENFGIAVLEAAHAGTPVLTTTGTPWQDQRDVDGFFIASPSADSLADVLAEAVSRINKSWSELDRKRLGRWALDHYNWDSLGALYEDAYRQCTSVSTCS